MKTRTVGLVLFVAGLMFSDNAARNSVVHLRPARLDDWKFLLNLRNDEAVRKASFSTNPVSEDGHRRWLAIKLASPDCQLLVAEINGDPAGQVRFDRISATDAEVSIALVVGARGKGQGAEILRQAAEAGFAKYPELERLLAHIKNDNPASVRSFEKAGYVFGGTAIEKGQLSLEFVLKRPL